MRNFVLFAKASTEELIPSMWPYVVYVVNAVEALVLRHVLLKLFAVRSCCRVGIRPCGS
jgi:hypothetical protein